MNLVQTMVLQMMQLMGIKVLQCRITLGTADGSVDDVGMVFGADDGTSECVLVGHASVVVLLGSADGTAADGAHNDGALFGMGLGADDGTSDGVSFIVMLGSADGATVGAATDGILLGIEAGIVDNTADGSVMLVQLMGLKVLQCFVSYSVQRMVVQMIVLCLAWSSVQTMELQIVPCLAMPLLLYCLVQLMVLLLVLLLLCSKSFKNES